MSKKQTLSKELIAASSESAILTILKRGENYGYAIIQQVQICSENQMQWTEGMLYPVLHRLEAKGFIVSRWAAGEGGPRRKFYRITAQGRKQLDRHQKEWEIVSKTLRSLSRLCQTWTAK